jgi:hypothetical protein
VARVDRAERHRVAAEGESVLGLGGAPVRPPVPEEEVQHRAAVEFGRIAHCERVRVAVPARFDRRDPRPNVGLFHRRDERVMFEIALAQIRCALAHLRFDALGERGDGEIVGFFARTRGEPQRGSGDHRHHRRRSPNRAIPPHRRKRREGFTSKPPASRRSSST